MTIIRPPTMSVEKARSVAEQTVLPKLENATVSRQIYNNLPIPVFINEVFGNQLAPDFVVNPSVSNTQDLVTMRLNSLMSKQDAPVNTLEDLMGKKVAVVKGTTTEKVLDAALKQTATDAEVVFYQAPSSTPPTGWSTFKIR